MARVFRQRGARHTFGGQSPWPPPGKTPEERWWPRVVGRTSRYYTRGVWEVDVEYVADWLASLDDDSRAQVVAAIQVLQEFGPQLGRPLVDSVVASRHRNMKELRPGSSGRSELRVLFALDPVRRGILLVAGDKAGNWQRWYRQNLPIADDLFDEHLRRLREE